ncbi:hypothetical protein HDV00_011006 [Rhizophlyctis rosea]|nr:hypothetical protein HDV00_011006 [Rhizophlyctis rosea]
MKLILTGATGMTGGTVLRQCLSHPSIEEVTVLTRRPLPDIGASPKLHVILHQDFTDYAAVMDRLTGCLGGKFETQSEEDFTRMAYTFPINAAKAFVTLSPSFRFIHLSGMGVDQTESVTFPWQKVTRNVKGRCERHLNELTTTHPTFENYNIRPAGIIPPNGTSFAFAAVATLTPFIVVKAEDLASAMIKVALDGHNVGEDRVISNEEIKKIAAGNVNK